MQFKLFSCHHLQPRFVCNTEIFQTLVSNIPAPADRSFMSDLDGMNIAGDNLYAELRHQFFVWKNLSDTLDYIGFEHYRRPFFIDPYPADAIAAQYPEIIHLRRHFAAFNIAGLRRSSSDFETYLAARRALDGAAIQRVKSWISNYDIIVPKSNSENIELQWKQFHDHDAWDVMVEAIKSSRFFAGRQNYISFELQRCYFANMYIMRRDLLDEYLTFCFDVLATCRARMALTGRALGYFSERVFSFWLYQKRIENPLLRVHELPFIFHDTTLDEEVPVAARACA